MLLKEIAAKVTLDTMFLCAYMRERMYSFIWGISFFFLKNFVMAFLKISYEFPITVMKNKGFLAKGRSAHDAKTKLHFAMTACVVRFIYLSI